MSYIEKFASWMLYAIIFFASLMLLYSIIIFVLKLFGRKFIYRKYCRFNIGKNNCVYTKNYCCFNCNDYMEEMVGLNLLEHIQISETKKNRSQQLWLTFFGFIFSSIAILISIINAYKK